MKAKSRAIGAAAVIVLAVLAWLFFDYFTLPAYTFQSSGTWILAGFLMAAASLGLGLLTNPKRGLISGGIFLGGFLLLRFILGFSDAIFWPGNGARYYGLMPMQEKTEADFSADFSAAGSQFILPVIDKDIAYKIAQGKLGSYGAQFSMLYGSFTQQTVRRGGKDVLVRTAPLDYSGTLVALTRGRRGTAGYVEVDVVTEEARLVEVPGGMKYTPGAVFGYDLMRRARFAARSALLGPYTFEVDDSGHPWWVFPVLRHSVGLFGGAEVSGVLLVDAVDGRAERYALGAEPSWVERVYPTDLIIAQANERLSLKDGWVNRDWGEKRDVFQVSDGYNYVATSGAGSGRTWFVSGVTSPSESDQTSVGLLMVDLRTKEARRYALSGITEMRAMQIAQSDERVRAQNLSATWPIATTVDSAPAYFMILKNEVQRQKFVFVDMATGADVAMGETIDQARVQFSGMRAGAEPGARDLPSARLTVLRVSRDAQDGSVAFLATGDPSAVYVAQEALGPGVRFLSPGDEVSLRYRVSESSGGQRFVQELRNLSIGEAALAEPGR